MISFDNFITTNTGKGIDTDGAFGFQCMDLMHAYCRDVLGLSDLSILAQPNAKSVWTNFNNVKGHELFDKIVNTPTGVPLKGDIMLYNFPPDGHVDIFIQGDVNSFRSFSQNFPTGSKSIVVNHPNYNGVYGWLRLKPITTVPMAQLPQAELDALIKARNDNWDGWQAEKAKVVALTEENKALRNNLAGRDAEIASLKKKLSDIKTIIG